MTQDVITKHGRAACQRAGIPEAEGGSRRAVVALSPSEVAAIRAKLGLTQRNALVVGPCCIPEVWIWSSSREHAHEHLLRLLANDPSRLGELADASEQLHATRDARRDDLLLGLCIVDSYRRAIPLPVRAICGLAESMPQRWTAMAGPRAEA